MYPIVSKNLKVTSNYGNRSYKYKGKIIKDFHHGIDLVGGDTIVAFADGTITSVSNKGEQYGRACYVSIKHANGYRTLYYHLKSGSVCVHVGEKVKKGEKIGIIGATGQATGVHLHFQIDKGTSASSINPYDYVFKDKTFIPTKDDTSYYKKCNASYKSIVDALKSINVDASFTNRTRIATKNGIKNYTGTASQNILMLDLLKKGKLKK